MSKIAIAVESSDNAKLGKVSATYASQASCPSSCPFRNAGCYAESGYMRFTTSRLNAEIATAEDVARAEAEAILKLQGKLPLRLHVVGDAPSDECARIVSDASAVYTGKHGMPVWSYTHAWREVERESWGAVSIIASCETTEDVVLAQEKGYATAIVREQTDDVVKDEHGAFVVCPNQTRGVKCDKCRLCMKDTTLHGKRVTIVFRPHGSKANTVKDIVESLATA